MIKKFSKIFFWKKIFEDGHLRGLMVASDDFGKIAKF